MLSDCWRAEERGMASALYSLAPFLGPAVGPIGKLWRKRTPVTVADTDSSSCRLPDPVPPLAMDLLDRLNRRRSRPDFSVPIPPRNIRSKDSLGEGQENAQGDWKHQVAHRVRGSRSHLRQDAATSLDSPVCHVIHAACAPGYCAIPGIPLRVDVPCVSPTRYLSDGGFSCLL